jgi:nicotinamidase/pyrazinamidase
MILWDIDTQFDFMRPEGKLYVPDAEEIAPAMQQLVEAARAAGIVHVASADDHELTDDDAAIRGFLARGPKVRFVADTARGLNDTDVVACTTSWRSNGVKFTSVSEVLASL